MSRPETVVSLAGVTKTFPKGGVTAVQEIDLDVGSGEFISLIGPSGCGKSTLLRIVGDLVSPSAGTVSVNGKTAERARLDRDYGIVFQAAVLYDWRTVTKNIALPLELLGWDRSRRQARVAEMLELVELTGFEGHYPWQLSGGMQQRVSIARALSFEPALLLRESVSPEYPPAHYRTRGVAEGLALAAGSDPTPEYLLVALGWRATGHPSGILHRLGIERRELVRALAERGIPVPDGEPDVLDLGPTRGPLRLADDHRARAPGTTTRRCPLRLQPAQRDPVSLDRRRRARRGRAPRRRDPCAPERDRRAPARP